jgi:hypothetical protein
MTLNDCIIEILGNFNPGDFFDSHTVIDGLLLNRDYHLAYLREYPASNAMEVRHYHGNIAKMIRDSGLVKQIGNSKSHTIYGNLSDNALWQKL